LGPSVHSTAWYDTDQRVGIAVDVDNASLPVLDEVDDSSDEVVDGQSWWSAQQRSQIIDSLQCVTLRSPALTQRRHQEPVEAPAHVQVTWSVQTVLALRRIDKLKVRHLELQADTTYAHAHQPSFATSNVRQH